MGRAFTDIAVGIIAGSLQCLHTLPDAIGILLRAAALENHADCLCVLYVLRGILAALTSGIANLFLIS